MKEIDDLKVAVRKHIDKLQSKGLYVQSIQIECTRDAPSGIPVPPYNEQRVERKVVVNITSEPDSRKMVWF